MKLSVYISFFVGILMVALPAEAQMVSCNAFLQGNHAEVGINWMGAYGSTVAAPTGYHPHLTGSSVLYNSTACGSRSSSTPLALGFVADPNFTGWTAYYGDYYLPGTPQEGWALEIMGHKVLAYTYLAASQDSIDALSGSNISYGATATGVTSTWEGIFDSMKVTQVTTLDTGALFFTVNITLTNLSAFPRDSVYYMRTIDPDNDVTLSGSFTTSNHIDKQMPGGPDSMVSVSAHGLTYTGAQIALATKDPRATCFILTAGLMPSSTERLSNIHSHLPSYQFGLGDSSVTDNGIGLVFNIGHLASVDSAADSVLRSAAPRHPANSSSLKFIYSFDAHRVGAFLTDTTTRPTLAVGTASNAIEAPIHVFPNPTNGNFQLTGLVNGDNIALYDITGRDATQGITISTANQLTILSNVPKGNYI
ncbi:MAG: T9SS C-terminal target domain-containing protein, partial [Chitinophagia bacterium]|nr:T9SS C-terminal target domain-containing protein [Chitinophagia bacterium]